MKWQDDTCRRFRFAGMAVLIVFVCSSPLEAQDDGRSNEYRFTVEPYHNISGDLTGSGQFGYGFNPDQRYQRIIAEWPDLNYQLYAWFQLMGGLNMQYRASQIEADTLTLRPFFGPKFYLPNPWKWQIYNYIETQPANDNLDDLATKLNNPVAELVSVPLQNNFDFGGGFHNHGFQYKLNVQPVIPFGLGDKWTLITRTIIPFISQNDRVGNTSQTGLGDTTLSLFFFAQGQRPGRHDLGRRPRYLFAHRHGRHVRRAEIGCRPNRLDVVAKTGMDLWRPGRSDLVVRR